MKILKSLPLFALFLWALPASAQDAGLQRQETKQQQIREATARASTQLSQLVNEFERNGIAGQDVDILRSIHSVLGKLSAEQMAQIVTLLKDARRAAPDATSIPGTKIITAYTGQKAVIVQLRQVLLEYQRQLALDEIARRVRELGDRQSSNLHEGLALLTAAERNGAKPSHKISIQLQSSEQSSVRDETGHILERLVKIAEATGEGPEDRPRRGVAFTTERKLTETLAMATQDLETGKLMSAASNEKSARDTLWQLADLLQSEKPKTDQLIEAAAKLEELIEAEKDIIEKTEKLDEKPEIPGEEKLALDPRVEKATERLEAAVAKAEEKVAVGFNNALLVA